LPSDHIAHAANSADATAIASPASRTVIGRSTATGKKYATTKGIHTSGG